MEKPLPKPFSGYQKFVVFILAVTQFTVILDFMVMSPLGDMLMKSLSLKPSAFGFAVSAYAFSAGLSSILTAGFADKYDRKKLLLFFYTGFILGTVCCGLAESYAVLVTARIVTGLFGGVIGSISMAIITDLFLPQQRGRVMGFVQMGFGASQVLGVPVGLYLANLWNWEATFWMVAAFSTLVAVVIAVKLKPVREHLLVQRDKTAYKHLLHTLSNKNYQIGFLATALLSIGGFMMMPFGSAFAINNLGVTEKQLPTLFMVSGIASLVMMPFIGKLSDKIDKFTIFACATAWMMIMACFYTNLSITPLWQVMIFNILLMMGIMNRMIPASALTSMIPAKEDRGAFMSITASLQQVAGGIGAAVSGMIVHQESKGSPLLYYNRVAYVILFISAISIFLMWRVKSLVKSVENIHIVGQSFE